MVGGCAVLRLQWSGGRWFLDFCFLICTAVLDVWMSVSEMSGPIINHFLSNVHPLEG